MILLSMVCCAVPSPYSSPAGSSAAQRAVTDGVSAESKESIAGYLRLALGNAEEAIKIAQAYLVLAYGGQVEMRPVVRRRLGGDALAGHVLGRVLRQLHRQVRNPLDDQLREQKLSNHSILRRAA